MKTGNKSIENVAEFIYMGMTVANKNYIYKEIKRGLCSGNACYHSVQNLFLSHLLLPKNVKIKMYQNYKSTF
jgi:hypothetical protein